MQTPIIINGIDLTELIVIKYPLTNKIGKYSIEKFMCTTCTHLEQECMGKNCPVGLSREFNAFIQKKLSISKKPEDYSFLFEN